MLQGEQLVITPRAHDRRAHTAKRGAAGERQKDAAMRRAALALALCTLVDALQLHRKTHVRRRTATMALRLDQPLLRIGNKVTNWVPAVGAVAGATVVGAAAVVAGGYGL